MASLNVVGLAGGYSASDEIVKGIDLQIAPSDFAVIVGPNGAGKSTFLKMVAGLVKPRRGSVQVVGTAIRAGDPADACRHGVAFVPQERNVFGSLSVRENLEVACYASPAVYAKSLDEQLARFPILVRLLSSRASSLSGGQRQVVALAMALMTCPKVLLLDEPTAGLSPGAAQEALLTIATLARSGLAVLMVEQNALIALAAADRGIVLVAGQKVRDQSATSLANDPEIRTLFLGRH
ncbi:ABC transporter ATP-binding protein [Paraburkholderia nemoris]|uniref:High-affinity branched-chain amino acid transport ATP-binding protein LivF n=1 Tax=Paraburkholderia nemoris TaxID=2793076 RepID=A0ABM8SXW8_9BURK|nr:MULTISPECIES: ATP-binding cassette domain-containing protein [Paraburkholderia]MBK3815244.1 ATP-binding cassette domain-containing protein [Paraburkholderia aspalathi]CAE6714520.1 High-affinity branched-chain amino acid transport ATP-binding protein LivF [Paraburkholderia nemoris]CAE6840266.1 High-affinity branched-chain amino acid transport ATP-binding protein LivF [Paraburkholderia nemoris]